MTNIWAVDSAKPIVSGSDLLQAIEDTIDTHKA